MNQQVTVLSQNSPSPFAQQMFFDYFDGVQARKRKLPNSTT